MKIDLTRLVLLVLPLSRRCRCMSTGAAAANNEAPKEGISIESLKEAVAQLNQSTDRLLYAALLRQCGNFKALSEGKQVQAQIIRWGLDGDTFLGNLLVQMYGHCGSLQEACAVFEQIHQRNVFSWTIMVAAYTQNGQLAEARNTFERMPERNVVSWNGMVAAYAQNGHSKQALEIYRRMNMEGEMPNEVTLLSVLDACASPEFLAEGKAAHARIVQSGFMSNPLVRNALVSMYGKCESVIDARYMFENLQQRDVISWNTVVAAYGQNGHAQEARQMFDKMPERNIVSWNAMVAAYAQNGYAADAVELFQKMETENTKPNEITYISILDACATHSLLAEGRRIHAGINDVGLQADIVVGTLLVNMYGKCGSPKDAKAVFDQMSQWTVISWNAMISAYVQNGYCKEALDLFRRMDLEGFQADKITLITVVDACNAREAKVVHASIADGVFEADAVVGAAFVSLYGKCSSLEDSWEVFERIPQRSIVSWNSMIAAYTQNAHGVQAFELFQRADMEGFQADAITVITVLEACSNLPLQYGKMIHSAMRDSPLQSDVMVGSSLINMYGKCKDLEGAKLVFKEMPERNVVSWTCMLTAFSQNGHLLDARSIFDKMPEKSLISWNAMVAAYAQNGQDQKAVELFWKMVVEGMMPDNGTFMAILDSCATTPLGVVKLIHTIMINNELQFDELIGSALVKMYGKCGSLEDAAAVFAKMPQHNPASWNVIIAACGQNGHAKKSLEFFQKMDLEGVKPNNITFISMLDACTTLAALPEAKLIHSGIVDAGLEADMVISNALVNLYGKCGYLINARNVFEKMPQRNIVSWTAIIASYGQNGHSKEALELFRRMDLEGVPPDDVTFVCVLSALSHAGQLNECVHHFIAMQEEHGVKPGIEHFVCIIDLLGRAGQLDKAEELITSMPFEPECLAWMTLLGACRTHGNIRRGERAADNVLEIQTEAEAAVPYVLLSNVYAA